MLSKYFLNKSYFTKKKKKKKMEKLLLPVFISVLLSTWQHNSSSRLDVNVCLTWLKSDMPRCVFGMWTRHDLKLHCDVRHLSIITLSSLENKQKEWKNMHGPDLAKQVSWSYTVWSWIYHMHHLSLSISSATCQSSFMFRNKKRLVAFFNSL